MILSVEENKGLTELLIQEIIQRQYEKLFEEMGLGYLMNSAMMTMKIMEMTVHINARLREVTLVHVAL